MTDPGAAAIGVLLVDDHPVVRTGLRLVIQLDVRLRVVGEVETGREAIACVERLAPDVVVMDISLPDIGGVQATREIKRRWPGVRVLVVSTHSDEEYVVGALEAGAEGYLLKGRAAEELRDGILRVFNRERVIDPAVMPAVIARATRRAQRPTIEPLSEREREVLELMAGGATSKEIARALGLSPKTVENHRAHILDKLGAVNTAAAVRAALAHRLIPPAAARPGG